MSIKFIYKAFWQVKSFLSVTPFSVITVSSIVNWTSPKSASSIPLASFFTTSSQSIFLSAGTTCIIVALTGSKVRKWSDVPNIQYLIKRYTTLPYDEVLKRNAGEMANAVMQIENQNNYKSRPVKWSWYLLIIGLTTAHSPAYDDIK